MMRALLVLVAVLSSCTVIYQSGSNNTIRDAADRGDLGISREVAPASGASAKPSLLDRLRGHEAH